MEPLLIVASTSAGTEVDLPDRALLVAGRACSGLVRDISNQIVDGRGTRGWSINVYTAVCSSQFESNNTSAVRLWPEFHTERTFSEIQAPERKVHDRGIFLLDKHVLCESLEVENNIAG